MENRLTEGSQSWDGNPETSERLWKKSFGTDESDFGEDEVKD